MQQPPYGYAQQQPPAPKRGMSTAAKVLIALAGIFLFGAGSCVVCVGIGAKAASDASHNGSRLGSSTRSAEAPKTFADVKLETLLADYKANEVRADGDYKGQYCRVSGIVGDIKKGLLDDMYVMIGTGKTFEIPQVQCHLGADQASKAASLSKGQRVSVTGRIDGLLGHVHLKECEIQ